VALIWEPAPTILMAALFPGSFAKWDHTTEQAWFMTEEGNFLPNEW
jgi:hypothetical protein